MRSTCVCQTRVLDAQIRFQPHRCIQCSTLTFKTPMYPVGEMTLSASLTSRTLLGIHLGIRTDVKSTPRAVPQKVALHQISSGWKYEKHYIKIIESLSIKSEILLYSCGKLCLYNQIIRFPHKLC